MFDQITVGWVAVIVSELIALALIWRLWRSDDHLFFKISLSLFALLPILGPLLTWWIANFPNVAPRILQDRNVSVRMSLTAGDMFLQKKTQPNARTFGVDSTRNTATKIREAAVTAAKGLHQQGYGVAQGCDASLVLLKTRDVVEAIRLRANRLKVLRKGKLMEGDA